MQESIKTPWNYEWMPVMTSMADWLAVSLGNRFDVSKDLLDSSWRWKNMTRSQASGIVVQSETDSVRFGPLG